MLAVPGATAAAGADEDSDDGDDAREAETADDDNYLSADDDTRGDAQTREDAGADWLADQGFDRKD